MGLFIFISSTSLSSTSPSIQDETIHLSNVIYQTFQINGKEIFLKSKQGSVNPDIQDIKFTRGIEAKFTLENNAYELEANTLTINPIKQSIISKEEIKLKTSDFEIVSLGLNIYETSKDGMKMLFEKARFGKIKKQNSKPSMTKGKANNIEFFPEKNLILMKGKAELYQDNMKISSDEIHYDLNQDKILKSFNAKIINNS